MTERHDLHRGARVVIGIIGVILPLACWYLIKALFRVPDLYLPSPESVIEAAEAIEPGLMFHTMATLVRLVVGYSLGTALGIAIGILSARWRTVDLLISPTVHSLRAVPAAAAVPFFLMWFGFAETGRYLIVLCAVAFNVAVAAQQILSEHSRPHLTFFRSYEVPPGSLPIRYSLPRVFEDILPTLRYSLALSIGAVAVAELLGAQVGLGYLLQSGRSTFSFNLMFLAIIVIGAIASALDLLLKIVWRVVVYWRPA